MEIINKIFKMSICAGMIGDRHSPISRASTVVKWVMSHAFALIYFVLLRILWNVFSVKIPEGVFYLLLFSIIIFNWYIVDGYYVSNLQKANEVVRNTYSEKKLKSIGKIGLVIMFSSPMLLLIFGIPLISNYKRW